MHREGDLLRFQTRPNIYRMIAQSAQEQPAASVAERLRGEVGKVIGAAEGFRVLEWAATDGQIADRPEPTIAVLEAKYAVTQENGDAPAGRERLEQLWAKAGGGFRQWRNALLLVAPDNDLWGRAEEVMREVMAYESVIDTARKRTLEISQLELKDLNSRFSDRKESLRASIATAYRWVFFPGEQGLESLSLPVPAVRGERIVGRVVERLADQNYGQPKILRKMGADYFNNKFLPRLWPDEGAPLDLGELRRRFLQWTYLPILLKPDETLRACIAEGLTRTPRFWAVAIGDASHDRYRQLIERPDELSMVVDLFDGSASLVRGAFLDLIREALKPATPDDDGGPGPGPQPGGTGGDGARDGGGGKPPVIVRPKHYTQVRLRLGDLNIAKTSHL